jgi:nitrite reductase (cytochrome c-552)
MKRSVKYLRRIICVTTVAALLTGAAGCGRNQDGQGAPDEEKPNQTAQVMETGSGVTVIKASDWAQQHPDIYDSYMKNANNSGKESKVEKYPVIAVLYEGIGFAKSYNSARGHVFSKDDILATGRAHALANCFACKTPDFTAIANELGEEAYKIPFEEMAEMVTEPISCFDCHANEPGKLVVTHTYLADAMGKDFQSIAPAVLACAQCHA